MKYIIYTNEIYYLRRIPFPNDDIMNANRQQLQK